MIELWVLFQDPPTSHQPWPKRLECGPRVALTNCMSCFLKTCLTVVTKVHVAFIVVLCPFPVRRSVFCKIHMIPCWACRFAGAWRWSLHRDRQPSPSLLTLPFGQPFPHVTISDFDTGFDNPMSKGHLDASWEVKWPHLVFGLSDLHLRALRRCWYIYIYMIYIYIWYIYIWYIYIYDIYIYISKAI